MGILFIIFISIVFLVTWFFCNYFIFKKEFDMIWKYLKPEMVKIWNMITKGIKETLGTVVDFLLKIIEQKAPKVAEWFGINERTRKIEKEVRSRVEKHEAKLPEKSILQKIDEAIPVIGKSRLERQTDDIVFLKKAIEDEKKDYYHSAGRHHGVEHRNSQSCG